MDEADRQLAGALPWDPGTDQPAVPCPTCLEGKRCPAHRRKRPKDPAKQRQGRTNKRRGADFERHLVKLATKADVPARKVPLSGRERAKGFGGDVLLEHPAAHELRAEAKVRRGRLSWLRGLLEGNELAVLGEEPKDPEPLVLLRLTDYLNLLKRGRP